MTEAPPDAEALRFTLGIAVTFSAIHFLAPRLHRFFGPGRPELASAAGGMAVAFAIVVLLPEFDVVHAAIGNVVYPVILLGLVVFYAIELGLTRERPLPIIGNAEAHRAGLHVAVAWLYSWGLIYAMPAQAAAHPGIVLVTALAVGLHLAYKDYLMSVHHDAAYLRWGRLALAAAPLTAWAMAATMEPSPLVADLVLALVAGYLLQNVFRNELPADHLSSPASFALGALGFGLPVTLLVQL